MTSVQEKLLCLVEEVREICNANNLKYYLSDRLAWDAVKFKKFHDKTYDACIAMPISDIKKFISIVEMGSDNRSIESWSTNSSLKSFYIRYVAEDSMIIDLDTYRRIQKHGIALEIRPLMTDFSAFEEEVSYLEYLNDPSGFDIAPKRPASYNLALRNKSLYARKLFKKLINSRYRKDAEKAYYRSVDHRSLAIGNPAKNAPKMVYFEGKTLPVFSNYDEFFGEFVGRDWKKINYNQMINLERYGVVSDPSIPYKTYIDFVKPDGILRVDQLRMRNSLNKFYSSEVKPLEALRTEERRYLWRVADSIRLWEWYYPLKSRIQKLYDNKEYALFDAVLEDYTTRMKDYYSYGLTLYFDEECYLWAIESLERNKYEHLEGCKELHEKQGQTEMLTLFEQAGIRHPLLQNVDLLAK